jgi:hypothetical protein
MNLEHHLGHNLKRSLIVALIVLSAACGFSGNAFAQTDPQAPAAAEVQSLPENAYFGITTSKILVFASQWISNTWGSRGTPVSV